MRLPGTFIGGVRRLSEFLTRAPPDLSLAVLGDRLRALSEPGTLALLAVALGVVVFPRHRRS